MEFLLINHPLDCPVCDKGGECPLQNQAMSNGRGESRFAVSGGVKRTFPKPISISAQVLLDRERCVLCARCTRFSEEIAGDPFIALIERGALQQVGIYEKEPFESYFSGNTIQICPVGALTSAEYRFRSRPFDLVSTPSVAEHDACGSAIRVDHRRGKVMRRLAGNDPEVNEEWITDKDRFAFHYAHRPDRITYPQVRDVDDGARLRPASWPEAFAVAARGLADAGASAVLTGGRVTAEDAFAYSKFARVALGTNDIDFRARPLSAEETSFLASEVVLRQGGDVRRPRERRDRRAGRPRARGRGRRDLPAAAQGHPAAGREAPTRVVSIAPFASRGLQKLDGQLVATRPGREALALQDLAGPRRLRRRRHRGDPGRRAAGHLARRAERRRRGWPRRPAPSSRGCRAAPVTAARSRAGCLPNLLPGGRPVADAAARVDAATTWGVDSLPETAGRDADADRRRASTPASSTAWSWVASTPTTPPTRRRFRAALDRASFVVALELRESEVTRVADVVFPVAPVSDKAGTFVTWEGRPRPFEAVFSVPVVAARPAHPGRHRRGAGGAARSGFRTVAEARAQMEEMGPWDGERAAPSRPVQAHDVSDPGVTLATWKQMLDNGTMQDGDDNLRATARMPVARVSANVYDALGPSITLTGDRGSVTLPAVIAEMADDVVWVPANSTGRGLLADVGLPGSTVTLKGAEQ